VRCSKTKGGDFVGRDEDFDGGFDCHQGAMRLLTVLQEDFARKTSAEDLQEVWRDLAKVIHPLILVLLRLVLRTARRGGQEETQVRHQHVPPRLVVHAVVVELRQLHVRRNCCTGYPTLTLQSSQIPFSLLHQPGLGRSDRYVLSTPLTFASSSRDSSSKALHPFRNSSNFSNTFAFRSSISFGISTPSPWSSL